MKALGLALMLAIVPISAGAHVTATPNSGAAGAYVRLSFAVTHGCDGSATTEVRIRLPPEIVTARAQAKPGWTIEIVRERLAVPVPAGHGKTTDQRVVEVVWKGARLDDAHYDEFGLSLRLPAQGNQTLFFPVTQICEDGSIAWHGVPAPGQAWSALPAPAPYVVVNQPLPAAGTGGGHRH